MRINSVSNSNYNNNPSFQRIYFDSKSVDGEDVLRFFDKNVVNRFENSKHYDLYLMSDFMGKFFYKIKVVGQGIRGFLQNRKAPWGGIDSVYSLKIADTNKYIKTFLPSKKQERINNQVEKQFASAMDELGDLSKLKEKADKIIRTTPLKL